MKTPSEIFFAIKSLWWRRTIPWRLRRKGISCGTKCAIYGMPLISMAQGSKICIGDRVSLVSESYFTALGVARPSILRTLLPGAKIIIGSDTGISGAVVCSAVSVEIGKNCLIGADVLIADTDFHPIAATGRRYANVGTALSAKIVIGDNVFIGARAMVLKGVNIGSNSVIGAGSVVTTDIPARVIAAGVPARVVKGID